MIEALDSSRSATAPGADDDAVVRLGIGAQRPYERDASIAECFAACVARDPHAAAVVDADGSVSYEELDRASRALACHLAALGVLPGDAVAVAIERSRFLPVALLGILKTGAAYVPIDSAYGRDRIAHIRADAGFTCAIVAGNVPAALTHDEIRIVDLVGDAATMAFAGAEPLPRPATAASLAYVMYTSGSTGRPKGVAIEQRAILRLVRNTDFVPIAADDVFLQFAPPAFDASTFEIWAPLLNGATLAIPRQGPLSLEEVGDEISRFGVTTLWLTAPLFRMMVESELPRFAALRNLLTGGDTVPAEHAKRFRTAAPAVRLINGYGPTENTTFSCCYTVPEPHEIGASLPIGRPIANASAHVLDADLRLLPPGEAGELFVGGDGLARSYLNLPDLTAERFIANPFGGDGSRLYRTGDRARMRPDGIIEFLGRADNQVKIRGFRIELDEVEMALHAHPAVLHAVVIADERAGEKTLHAVIVRVPSAQLTPAELRESLAGALPGYMLPHRFTFRDSLPQFTSGKIDRVSLMRELHDEPAAAPRRVPVLLRRRETAGPLAEVTAIWQILLQRDDLDPDENFFDAGGDSLQLLTLHKRLRERFALTLSVTDLFRDTTIRRQAALIERVRA